MPVINLATVGRVANFGEQLVFGIGEQRRDMRRTPVRGGCRGSTCQKQTHDKNLAVADRKGGGVGQMRWKTDGAQAQSLDFTLTQPILMLKALDAGNSRSLSVTRT
jgi:hypothetical protein